MSTLPECKPSGFLIDSDNFVTLARANTGKSVTFPADWRALDLTYKFCGECAGFHNIVQHQLLADTPSTAKDIFSNREDEINSKHAKQCLQPTTPGELVLDLSVNGNKFFASDSKQAAVIPLGETSEGCLTYFISWEDITIPYGDQDYSDMAITMEVCDATDTCDSGVKGDPHITTWSHEHFDFQGECDLVFVDNPDFMHGTGMHIHGRTKLHGTWSAISSGAIKIGDDVLEIHGEDQPLINGNVFLLNVEDGTESPLPDLGGYSLTVQQRGPHSRRFIVHLGNGERIFINNFKEYVDIYVESPRSAEFAGSNGLMGSWNQGSMLGRDGETIFEDADAFGQEWQVRDTDPQLFHIIEAPQYPAKCNMPEKMTAEQRHLRGITKKVSEDDARKACASVASTKMLNCVADVFGSDDIEMAGIYL